MEKAGVLVSDRGGGSVGQIVGVIGDRMDLDVAGGGDGVVIVGDQGETGGQRRKIGGG